MKKNSILIVILLTVFAFSIQSISAQITITIPKFPKLKKDKPQPKPESTPTTGDNQSAPNQQTDAVPTPPSDKCTEGVWLPWHLEEIAERQKEVDNYTPDRGWFVESGRYDHLLFSVSPTAKEKWLKGANGLHLKDCPNLVTALDKLAASAAKKLPLYQAKTKAYPIRNPLEEKLMKAKINDSATHKIFYTGLEQANWLISKNDLGIPTARYKHGMLWARDSSADHPYCHFYYVNIIQDYAGGGTYSASRAKIVGSELAGCPAS